MCDLAEKITFDISVRGLVEFILREGDIDNRGRGNTEQAMLEGARIHRAIQKRQGPEYHVEVPLYAVVPMGPYDLKVEGRADGLIEREREELPDRQLTLEDMTAPAAAEADALSWENVPVIDEIKGTYADIHELRDAMPLHLAQAKCYAYMHMKNENLDRMRVRLTYCSLETEEIRYFRYRFTAGELEEFFDGLISSYRRFSDHLYYGRLKKTASIRELTFPFEYRKGQRAAVGYVYRTITAGRKLFLEAPTGAGKTLAVIYPALKAIAEEKADRIFYMTARSIARTVPEQTFALLRERGLSFSTVTLTAKEKICVLDRPACDPSSCPRAKGHLSRVNDAIYALLSEHDTYDREAIVACAEEHRVCPFELSLDLSLFADGVICDYNYAFDPFVYLRRFFSEGAGSRGIFLVDEAHNLLERGRDMYSASISSGELEQASAHLSSRYAGGRYENEDTEKAVKRLKRRIRTALNELDLLVGEDCGAGPVPAEDPENLIRELTGIQEVLSGLLSDEKRETDDDELDFYFAVNRFLTISEFLDDSYIVWGLRDGPGDVYVRLFCADPSVRLRKCMERAAASILFSATLLPIQYYKALLGGGAEDYEAYAETSFSPEQHSLFIGRDVTTRYQARGPVQYSRMAAYIDAMAGARKGKYMVFFPSYSLLQSVARSYQEEFFDPGSVKLVIQEEQMTEESRESFLSWFTSGTDADISGRINMDIEIDDEKSVVGLCVMGGIFGEGIDLTGERLIGVMVVGTGLPMVTGERELIRGYFDAHGRDGFDYAYRYPGMNKVLQALGRLIRTENDRGVMLLLDDRFLQQGYQRLFPRELKNSKIVTTETVKNELKAFWSSVS